MNDLPYVLDRDVKVPRDMKTRIDNLIYEAIGVVSINMRVHDIDQLRRPISFAFEVVAQGQEVYCLIGTDYQNNLPNAALIRQRIQDVIDPDG